jgi:folate-binding protein YgfZ
MEKDQIILLEDRGLISITGNEAKNFLQNIITNDIEKVNNASSIFSALFTPQGKYLFEFFLIESKDGFLLDCDGKATNEIINYLTKYKLRSKIEIRDLSSEYIIGIISLEKFKEIQKSENKDTDTLEYRNSPIFIDTRNKKLGARILSTLKKLHLTIKKLELKIVKPEIYYKDSHTLGVPVKGVESLKEQLFGLEANFEELRAIDFKKGCFIGQENTARMKLKNKLRRRLMPIETDQVVNIGDEIKFKNIIIGKILISMPMPFALIKLFNPDILEFYNKDIFIKNNKVKLNFFNQKIN